MSTSEILRRAAENMRENANAASNDGFPWVARPHHARRNCTTIQTRSEEFLALYVKDKNGPHIAHWHPLVAFAVADLLDEAVLSAGQMESLGASEVDAEAMHHDALQIARAYLGVTS